MSQIPSAAVLDGKPGDRRAGRGLPQFLGHSVPVICVLQAPRPAGRSPSGD
jgi:hypothetical protein